MRIHVPIPTVIWVTGLPATGKSFLARQLGEQLGLPLFGKDQFKEILFDTLGIGDRPYSRKLGVASITLLFDVVAHILAAGGSCIAESNFSAELDSPRVMALHQQFQFQSVQVLCFADGLVLQQRFRSRERHPGHLDQLLATELEANLLLGRTAPMAIPAPLIEVDTTDTAKIPHAAILQQVRAMLN
jgi:predicted kinase